MKEIKTLIQQLRNYPNNLFVYPQEPGPDMYGNTESKTNKSGLVVCNLEGKEQGFIELGANNGNVVI